jgi:hypothetical protein
MRERLIRWLKIVLTWLEGPPVQGSDPVLAIARTLVRMQQTWPDRSGEAKRHQVYASLLKTFPDATPRRLSRVIEDALDIEVPA